MSKIFSSDTGLAFLGTLAAVLAVVISQQWLSDKRDAMTVLMDEYAGNRHLMVRIEEKHPSVQGFVIDDIRKVGGAFE